MSKINYKILILACLSLVFLEACRPEDSNFDQMNFDQLHSRFAGLLPPDFISALIYMGESLGYELSTLEDIGTRMLPCQGDLECLEINLKRNELADFGQALRTTTLPNIELDLDDNEFWFSDYDRERKQLVLNHRSSNLSLHFDLDNGLDDGRQPGIIPQINGTKYETKRLEATINLIRPTTDAGDIDNIRLRIEDEVVYYRFEGGLYSALSNSDDNDKVFLEGSCSIQSNKVILELRGLYYILLPKGGTKVTFQDEQGSDSFTVGTDADFLVYKENVTRLEIADAFPANIVVQTDAKRLQFDANSESPDFELDFDHSYKDRGQKVVTSYLTIDEELLPK